MAAPTGFGRAGASRFQLSHQSGATRRKNASIWCETTGGRHRLLNEINRLQPRQPWHAPCNNADDLPAGQPAMSIENIEKLIADHRVEFVDLRFSDMRGVQHHVTFPKSIIEPTLFEDGKMFDGSSISGWRGIHQRSAEHTSELQSLMRISYAVFCLK